MQIAHVARTCLTKQLGRAAATASLRSADLPVQFDLWSTCR